MRTQREGAVHKSAREVSPETNPGSTLISDFQSPDCEKIKVLFKPLRLWSFVTAAELTNTTLKLEDERSAGLADGCEDVQGGSSVSDSQTVPRAGQQGRVSTSPLKLELDSHEWAG